MGEGEVCVSSRSIYVCVEQEMYKTGEWASGRVMGEGKGSVSSRSLFVCVDQEIFKTDEWVSARMMGEGVYQADPICLPGPRDV